MLRDFVRHFCGSLESLIPFFMGVPFHCADAPFQVRLSALPRRSAPLFALQTTPSAVLQSLTQRNANRTAPKANVDEMFADSQNA